MPFKPKPGGPDPNAKWPEDKRGTPEWLAKIKKYDALPWRERPVALKYKQAICRQFKYGLTNQEIVNQLGCSLTTYRLKKNSNEGKALQAELEKFRGDDFAIVEAAMKDEAYNSFENLIEARDRMYAADQFEAAAKIDLKILEAIGFWKKADNFKLDLEGREIHIHMAETQDDFTAIPEADFEYVKIESPDPDDS